jgi:hypothetical protein
MEFNTENHLKELLLSFHRLRINGILSEKEAKSIFKKYCKYVKSADYTFEDEGFYEYKFTKLTKT